MRGMSKPSSRPAPDQYPGQVLRNCLVMRGMSTTLQQRTILIAILAILIFRSFPQLNSYMNVQNIELSRETTGEVLVSSAEKVFVNETLKNNSMHIRQNKNETDWTEKSSAIYARLPDIQQFAATQPSPVCRPNLNVALPDWRWDNITKFKRIYFYHAIKAGGTSLAQYFKMVANHYGLEYQAAEWGEAEEPANNRESSTFYVTHLREPVDRAVSHFKYQGRWSCRDLVHWSQNKTDWKPTHSNARKIESWNKTEGHTHKKCNGKHFFLGECAVNCYMQWFSGLSCPEDNISTDIQHSVALARLLRYNFIVILEELENEQYADSIEDFFGVEGVRKKRGAFCEPDSRKANALNPINITHETLTKLHDLNEYDFRLYNHLKNCGNKYEFGKAIFATRINKS